MSPGLLPEGESSRGSGDLGEERKAELAERLESAPTSHEDPKAERAGVQRRVLEL